MSTPAELRSYGASLVSHPAANGTIDCTERAGAMLLEAAAEIERLQSILPPELCACFDGYCRGGQVIAGRLSNGLRCKQQINEGPPHA